MTVGEGALWVLVAAHLGAIAIPSRHLSTRSARILLSLGTAAGLVAVFSLVQAFAAEDWGNVYVVDHTRSGLAWPIRLAGLWGGAEGSLLLWTALIAVASLVAVVLGAQHRTAATLPAAYALVVLLLVNPFERLSSPEPDGIGLQPVLEHPAMAWHPPILYAGLVGMVVPTLLALAGASVKHQRRSTLVAMALLTAGLVTGAAWAHAELGWGGYWAWDPIESAGLVAWLAAGATLHLLRPDHRASPVVALPGLAAVWATTLTRTGLVSSVHAFADRPRLRLALLVIAFSWTAALIMFMISKAGTADWAGGSEKSRTRLVGRGTGGFVLLAAAALVALGTYEPAVERVLGGDSVAIAGTYFATIGWPLAVGGAALAVFADRRHLPAAVGGLVGVLLVPWDAGVFGLALGAAGGAVTGSALAGGLRRSGWLAHAGIGLLLIGVGGTMATKESVVSLTQDQAEVVSGQTFTHRGIELVPGDTQDRAVATIDVDGVEVQAEIVAHKNRRVSTAEVATVRGVMNETQVLLRDGTDQVATYQINQFPRLNLVWLGAAVIVAGLALAVVPAGWPRGLKLPRKPVRSEAEMSDTIQK